jgi:hypothetical protein
MLDATAVRVSGSIEFNELDPKLEAFFCGLRSVFSSSVVTPMF